MTKQPKSKLEEFDAAEKISRYAANRLLFKWLSDDGERADLYGCLLKEQRVLQFQSRADTKERSTDDGDSVFQQEVFLLASRSHIEKAMKDRKLFSSAPYRALGSGTFMLGLDGADHQTQRDFAEVFLDVNKHIDALVNVAFKAAAVQPLKQRKFDLADLSEQAALRFVGFLFGFEQADHVLLESTMRKAYRGLNYQIVGRHFVSEPGAVDEATREMGRLLKRVAELLDLYSARVGRDQDEEFRKIEKELEELQNFKDKKGHTPLKGFKPVLRRIAEKKDLPEKYSGTDLAVIVVGLIAGTVGNVQAGVSIAINECFRDVKALESAREAARKSRLENWDYGATSDLKALIWEALRRNPPAAFLPRKTKDGVVILAIGGATRDKGSDPHQFIFGGPSGKNGFLHQCVGQHLALPLIIHVVRQVLQLPGLAQSLDPETGEPFGLKKLWGVICQTYPLEFKREEILTQSPLIVIMKVRTPVSVHAEALKQVIKYGAPRIEKKLRDAGHVHFAQFLFIENDTKLLLFTIYDRDFDSYIEHFALDIGPLFDRIFEHIEDAPPMPVDKFPKEFVDTIRRHNARPVAGYLFSAYPDANVSRITHEFPPENA